MSPSLQSLPGYLPALAHSSFGSPSSQYLALTASILWQIFPIYFEFFKDGKVALLPRAECAFRPAPHRARVNLHEGMSQ